MLIFKNLFLFAFCFFQFILPAGSVLFAAKPALSEFNYEAGMAKSDITGPPLDVMFWGYAREDQTGEGIHLRQFARALVIKDKTNGKILAYVTAEIGGVPHEIQRDVVERLRKEVDPDFDYANVLLNASHTHSGPAGFFHYTKNSVYTTKFFPEYYKIITNGIFQAIRSAYLKREPARLLLGKTTVEGAGINRSLTAYLANPEDERKKYNSYIDKTMLQITVDTRRGAIGFVNWYGVHPTNMTFNNRLISSDNKGVASYLAERSAEKRGQKNFIAIFAQANEGDVSPNLNLDNTGPGKDIFESTKIIGERQFIASEKILLDETSRALPSGLNFTQSFIDMPSSVVRKEFSTTGKEEKICAAAYGYAFAGGSTEEGGGHWLFKEGLTEKNRKFYIDLIASIILQSPTESLRECQSPKAILFPMGETKPEPSLPPILPLGLVTIGDFALIVSPNEVTTMSSRRMKETIRNVFGERIKEIALSGLTNEFAGYITTREEYSTQQYEGGHTLHGPASLDLFRQEYDRLARDLLANRKTNPGQSPKNISATVPTSPIPRPDSKGNFTPIVLEQNPNTVAKGDTVSCTVSSRSPNIGYPNQTSYFYVERKEGDAWKILYTDADWSTKFSYHESAFPFVSSKAKLIWESDANEEPGTYRLRHSSAFNNADAKLENFSVSCPEFQIK